MALSSSVLAASIKANIITCFGAADDDARLTCYCNALASAIVDHIVNNAVVLPTSLQDSMSGSVTGTGTVT
jgi:phosphate/sulfate permease